MAEVAKKAGAGLGAEIPLWLYRIPGRHVGLLTLCLADLYPGQWAAQDRTNIAKVERPGTQRENAPRHGDHAERVIPEQITNYEKSRTGDQTKNAAGRVIDES
ncbi:MAG: hypothetical protein ABSB79_14455 [Syntrophales bacterium]|jgi:hypothetical protein